MQQKVSHVKLRWSADGWTATLYGGGGELIKESVPVPGLAADANQMQKQSVVEDHFCCDHQIDGATKWDFDASHE
jgi:hypothetical protein